jgi:release factor glutamine methyltransferase
MKTFQGLEKRLSAAGNGNPKRSVEELTAHVLGCKPLEIYFKELSAAQEEHLEILIDRAELGEPIQYIIGQVDFRGLEIHCDRRALIPRAETELIVEEVLKAVSSFEFQVSDFLRIADVCTGTGCIGLALAHELPSAQVTAIDISPDALALAKENAQRLGLAERFQGLENNLLDGIDEASLDVVVSNPPYIFSKVWKNLDPCVRDFEPQLALDGGEDGMDLIVPLVEQAARVLKPGGGLFVEIGYDQGEAVFQCLEKSGFQNVCIIKDYAGLDRIVCGTRPFGMR